MGTTVTASLAAAIGTTLTDAQGIEPAHAEPLVDPADFPVPAAPAVTPYPANLNSNPKTGSQKAIYGSIVAFVIAVLGGVQLAVAAGADLANWQVWLNIVLVAVAGGAGTGGTVYRATNKVTYK